MIRTGKQYRDSIRDDREVYMNGERVKDVTKHEAFKPLVDIRARIYDMAHEKETQEVMTYKEGKERFAIGLKLPYTQEDWQQKRKSIDAIMWDIGGVVTRKVVDPEVHRQVSLVSMAGRRHSAPVAAFVKAAKAHRWRS